MLPKFALENRTVIGFVVALIIIGGVRAYFSMGRLEDPEFTIRTAFVVTVCPGATTEEVDSRITQVVERHVRRVDGVETVRSVSRPGLSIVYVDMRPDFPPNRLPFAWQELRNKMSELQIELPVEALPPQVHDDFGDVFGIILALSGDGYSDAELRDRAKELQRELQTLDQVGRVELRGVREETVEVNISRSRMAELSIHPAMILIALGRQNLQIDAGQMTLGNENIKISPGGSFRSIEEIADLIIPNGRIDTVIQGIAAAATGGKNASLAAKTVPSASDSGHPIRLRDIATINRTYTDPPMEIVRSNGQSAVAIAIAPVSGGNVIRMGQLVQKRSEEVLAAFPVGFKLDRVCYQPDNVVVAVNVFERNLCEAIIIVTVVVMLTMGWRSGILITGSLLVVILGTLCVLQPMGVVLQRASLGAFIVALGILVDDAVVVGDMILVNMQRGMNRKDACIQGARYVGPQLLGATIVGALAFLPVYLSPDDTGEYCRDLFIVLAVSLTLSWFVAMMQTPVVYFQFVHLPSSVKPGTNSPGSLGIAPHSGPVYQIYRKILEWVLCHKTAVFLFLFGTLTIAGFGFAHIDKIFFPPAQRKQLLVEYWRTEGTSIHAVADDMEKMERYLTGQPGVTQITSFIGGGPPRFYLPYTPEIPKQSYGVLVVNVEKITDVDTLIAPVENRLKEDYPQGLVRCRRFMLGPMTPYDVEVRFSGSDHKVLHELADKAKAVFRTQSQAKDIIDNWRQPMLVWTPEYSQTRGIQTAISRGDLNIALRWATLGIPTAEFHDGGNILPIRLRGTPEERNDFTNIENIPVWGFSLSSVPLGHLISGSKLVWQPSQIHHRNGFPTITAGCNPQDGIPWNQLFTKIRREIEQIPLPPGYSMEWGGQYSESVEAETTLLRFLPITLVLMAIITVALFNSLRQPIIIMLTFPLMLIGITIGLFVTGLSFGFMALVGAMSLLGMTVRNGVVLMSQIDVEMAKGDSPFQAIVDASVERLRPVTVAAMTVVVGMIPLLRDPLFNSMAAAIMFGLIFATIFTLFVVPMFYLIFFRIKVSGEK